MGDSFFAAGAWHRMEQCYTCKVQHSIPETLYQSALQSANVGSKAISIHCPYGHTWVYKSQNRIHEDEQIRLERDRLKQKLAEKDDTIRDKNDQLAGKDRQLAATRGTVTRIKNRISKGVCPCCNRTFQDLMQHMLVKHPNYKKEKIA